MSLETATPRPAEDFLDITPLARRYGFRIDVKIEKELAARASDETMIGCLLRAAADALMMRGSRPQAMNPLQLMKPLEAMSPLVFAIKTLRAPAQVVSHLRLAMHLDAHHCSEPTLTLRLAG
ncbi:MAG TPA: hypothetical protein VEW72_01970 [Burkholderiales bacterium]|jgi:hypothetical protein|nr:hypothetical protein [Burkholderiales bacterium]